MTNTIMEMIDSGEIDAQHGFDIIAALKAADEDKDPDELYQQHVDQLLSEGDPITGAILNTEE